MSEQSKPIPSTHTPGPWRWEVNLKSRSIDLCGGSPRFDMNVMDFARWGMSSATPRFLRPCDGIGMLLEPAHVFSVPVVGREHHEDWFRDLDHPDARLIAAAPELLAALKGLRDLLIGECASAYECVDGERADAAIAKAEGR